MFNFAENRTEPNYPLISRYKYSLGKYIYFSLPPCILFNLSRFKPTAS